MFPKLCWCLVKYDLVFYFLSKIQILCYILPIYDSSLLMFLIEIKMFKLRNIINLMVFFEVTDE